MLKSCRILSILFLYVGSTFHISNIRTPPLMILMVINRYGLLFPYTNLKFIYFIYFVNLGSPPRNNKKKKRNILRHKQRETLWANFNRKKYIPPVSDLEELNIEPTTVSNWYKARKREKKKNPQAGKCKRKIAFQPRCKK